MNYYIPNVYMRNYFRFRKYLTHGLILLKNWKDIQRKICWPLIHVTGKHTRNIYNRHCAHDCRKRGLLTCLSRARHVWKIILLISCEIDTLAVKTGKIAAETSTCITYMRIRHSQVFIKASR